MSGGTVHLRVLDSGDEYDMPEEEAMSAMYELEKAGRKFEADQPPAQGSAAIAASPEGIEPQPYPGGPSKAEEDHVLSLLRDPTYFAKNLAKTGANFAGQAIGAGGEGAGVIMNAGRQALGAGTTAATNAYLDQPNHPLDALLEGGRAAGIAGGAALGIGGVGRLAGAGGDRARVAAFGGDKQDLAEIGVTPRQFNQRTDELGLNNAFVPMDRSDKIARVGGVLDDAGQRQAAAIANADQRGVGQYRDWGGEIARDVEQNADRVWQGGSGQREGIVSAMGKTANAAESHPMESLADLRAYKTARAGEAYTSARGGLDESNYGKAALAASDSATQHLDTAMAQSGPQNYEGYKQANADFGDASILDEMLQQAPQSNPLKRTMGTAIASGIGGSVGGIPGAVAGAGLNEVGRPYYADTAANLGTGMARNLGAASELTGVASAQAGALKQTLDPARVSAEGRGNMLGDAATQLLQTEPQALGRWQQEIAQASQDGSVNQLIIKLNRDPEFRAGPGMRLQQMTAQQR